MTTVTKPDIAARIAALAQRLGFTGPDAAERALDMALEYLDDSTAEPKPLYTRERRDTVAQRNAEEMARQGYLDDTEPAQSGNSSSRKGAPQ